ncbi:MAG: XRE family transcriptional regulator, partial [Streptococcaceae bacterium]|nr:XRE family transcriptional regulator [Streptococcaceae bacterium]
MDGKELKKLRTKFGYTLRSFGQKVGLSHMAIQYYERDERTITETVERQIKQALGLSFDIKQDCDLHVHLDYLRLTFFDTSVETIGSKVIGIDLSYFTMQEKNINNYKRVYSCGMIKLYWSDDPKQGIMLELSGQGLKELEDHLEELGFTLIQWLLVVLDEDYFLSNHYYSRVQSSRIDLAIDEMWNEENGNYDIHDLQEKYQRGLVETRLETYDPRETEKRGEKQGLTIYWGSDTGDFKIRMYE